MILSPVHISIHLTSIDPGSRYSAYSLHLISTGRRQKPATPLTALHEQTKSRRRRIERRWSSWPRKVHSYPLSAWLHPRYVLLRCCRRQGHLVGSTYGDYVRSNTLASDFDHKIFRARASYGADNAFRGSVQVQQRGDQFPDRYGNSIDVYRISHGFLPVRVLYSPTLDVLVFSVHTFCYIAPTVNSKYMQFPHVIRSTSCTVRRKNKLALQTDGAVI